MAEQVTQVLGIVGIKNMGEYNSSTYYEKLNVVTYNGSSYCAKRSSQGILPTNTDYWQLYALKGEKGDTGQTGLTGEKGDKGDKGDNGEPGGKPLVASSISEMIDTTSVYVNTSDGKWYYYNGSAWTIGGTYQSTEIEDESIDIIKLEDKLQNFIKYQNDLSTATITIGSTISSSTGGITGNAKRARTSRLASNIDDVHYDYIYIDSNVYDMSVFGYTGRTQEWEDEYIANSASGWLNGAIFKIPSNFVYLACSFKRYDDADMQESDRSAIQSAVKRLKIKLDNTLEEAGKIPESKSIGDKINFNSILNASISMYDKFGICGASWDSGYIYPNASGTPIEEESLSWGANLGRRNGNNYYNFSRHSLYTKTWLSSSYGLSKLLNSDACNLYILTFGGNDSEQGTNYLGTIADIKEDYTQNPDTFYGNYARIIENIKIKSPNAKIICLNYYNPDIHTEMKGIYSEAIDNIAEHYGLPRINWNDDPWYSSSYMRDNLVHSHPTAVQLSGIALSFEKLYSKCVKENYSYFNNYVTPFINQ